MTIPDSFIEVKLRNAKDFLLIKETLTRIGIASEKNNTLYQSCHILHRQGHYYIVNFKEMFILDGKKNNLTAEDIARRNTIVSLLAEWNLLTIVNEHFIGEQLPLSSIKIITYADKKNWVLQSKYTMGKKRVAV